jgi:hypothetical protein
VAPGWTVPVTVAEPTTKLGRRASAHAAEREESGLGLVRVVRAVPFAVRAHRLMR